VSATHILWNLSARAELRAAVCGGHVRLFSALYATLVSWERAVPVLLAAVTYATASCAPVR